MKIIKSIVFIWLILTINACDGPCDNSTIVPVFIGFQSVSFDTVILRAYEPNDSFNHYLDSDLIVKNYVKIEDTIYYAPSGYTSTHGYREIGPDYDWEIYLPSINKTYRISKIVNIRDSGHKGCFNKIRSCQLDKQTLYPVLGANVPPDANRTSFFFGSNYLLYINK